MTKTHRVSLITAACLSILACAGAPRAWADHGHLEATFAFTAGRRDYSGAPWAYEDGGVSPALSGVFGAAPYDNVAVGGPEGEIRLVIDGLRMSYGARRPYARPGATATVARADTGGAVQVRTIDASERLYALGYEVPLGPTALFGDLVGTSDDVRTQVVVGDQQGTFRSQSFSYSLRGGVRVALRRYLFAYVAGEVGLDGNRIRGVELGVGLRTP